VTRGRLRVAGLSVLLLAAGCGGHLVYGSGPYRGKVVDADTKEPLAGAVVLAVWYREVPVAPHGPAVDYHDSLEILTDANGEFAVPERTHFTLIGKIREPDFVVYYPGYAPYPSLGAWPQGEEINAAYEKGVFHVMLSKLRTRQDRMRHAGVPVSVDHRIPGSKLGNLMRLVNEERRDLGLRPIGREGS